MHFSTPKETCMVCTTPLHTKLLRGPSLPKGGQHFGPRGGLNFKFSLVPLGGRNSFLGSRHNFSIVGRRVVFALKAGGGENFYEAKGWPKMFMPSNRGGQFFHKGKGGGRRN